MEASNGSSYYYDHFGNLIHRELADGEVQNYFYDLHDQLVKAEIFKKDGTKETWTYTYDALGRRIGRPSEKRRSFRRPPDSFGTAATSCRKSNRTADIPISTPIRIPTNRWHKYATGPMKTEKANSKPTTSTATKSAFRER
ncbi:hypothetical protein MBN60_00270 [Candidatus Saccharibacteria bacterium]|nr:hypothetical protein [Candidatus Saccharibacteria bacterium]